MSRKLDPDVPPVIGRYYEVPCTFVMRDRRVSWMPADGWVPVLGPAHADPELSAEHRHYHVDWRFVPLSCRRGWGPIVGQIVTSAVGQFQLGPIESRKKRCTSTAPEWPQVQQLRWHEFERNHRSACLRPGHICPHRGFAVGAFASSDGTAVCPGHGLKWDLKTGQNLPHHCKEGSP